LKKEGIKAASVTRDTQMKGNDWKKAQRGTEGYEGCCYA